MTTHMTKHPLNKKAYDFMSWFTTKKGVKMCFGDQNIKICLKEIVRMKEFFLFFSAHTLPKWRSKDYTDKKENQILLIYV